MSEENTGKKKGDKEKEKDKERGHRVSEEKDEETWTVIESTSGKTVNLQDLIQMKANLYVIISSIAEAIKHPCLLFLTQYCIYLQPINIPYQVNITHTCNFIE